MIDIRDIHSLSSFQRKTRAHIRRLRLTRRPEVLTVNGRAELVVQDAAAYQDLMDTLATRRSTDERRTEAELEPDPVIEAYKADVDRTLLRENLARSVDERLENLGALQRLADETGRAGRASRKAR
jgi:PHD/YefM family antitoxin component YafN of YafNO toxin-antitoxin module